MGEREDNTGLKIQTGRGVERHSGTGFSEETKRVSSVSRASLG